MLPRIIGQGRASELLYTGRSMSAEEGLAWGFFNRVAEPVLPAALELANDLAAGPTLAHAMTTKMLHQEWNVSVDQAIDMEAQAQAELRDSRAAPPVPLANDGHRLSGLDLFGRERPPDEHRRAEHGEEVPRDAARRHELMLTKDFHRAYEAFAAKRKPVFEGD